MNDHYTLRRLRWLRRLAHGGRNRRGISLEELSYRLSERLALVICGALAWAVITEVLK